MSSKKKTKKLWEKSMPKGQFDLMKSILSAPSPIGMEGAMTHGVLEPYFKTFAPKKWKTHRFVGNAGVVFDSKPDDTDALTVMIIGHADKIRMQVRTIGEDGKIWIDSDSFLPTTLIGHEVHLFSEDPDNRGNFRIIEGGTIEAIGAIHFADAKLRSGDRGIKKTMLYLELQIHGDKPKAQVEALGIRPGDSILLNRPIKRGFSPDTFYGAYLDNGLGCFVTAEVARLIEEDGGLKNIRVLYTMASHEEIGRFGSRVAAGELKPNVVIASDVTHDYKAAPGIGDRRMTPIKMGAGFTVKSGSVTSSYLNLLYKDACEGEGIPFQENHAGRDTGTDAMAPFLASIDAATTSIGFPIRNMHTISELGHTADVLTAIHGTVALLKHMDKANGGKGLTAKDFKKSHPRLDKAKPLGHCAPAKTKDKKG